MALDKTIEHIGIINEINERCIKVNLVNVSACAACHAKGACSVADTDKKVIEVSNFSNSLQGFTKGEKVNVTFDNSLGFKALFIGYVLPFVLLITTLFITSAYFTEVKAGLLSVGILFPYYLSLILFRKRFKSTFRFRLSKINYKIN